MTHHGPPPPEKLPAEKQERLHELLDRNSEGVITPEERTELESLVEEAEQLMIANSRRLAEFSQRDPGAPTGAVPVTVWIKPEQVES